MALTRVNGNLISSGTITGNLFLSNTITGDKIASATIGSSNLTSTGVTAGIYGGTGNTVNITVDAQGRVTSAANVASVATTPAGSTNQIQFNNAGAFGANPSFSFDGTSFTLDGSTKVQIFGSGSKIQMQTPTASANWYFETAGTNLTASSAQSGQFNIQNATAVTTFGVGGTTPSSSGAGITFPATQSASTDANTLDDYEEGSFTFTGTGFTTTPTKTAYYTKIGNQVTIRIPDITGTSNTTLCTITGLPVAIRSDSSFVSFLLVYNNSTGYNGHIYGGASNTIQVHWDAGESAFTASVVKGITNYNNFTYTIV